MIVLVLVLIWLLVLTPAIAHRLSSMDVMTSVTRFRADNRMLRRVIGHREDALPHSRMPSGPAGVPAPEAVFRHLERERIRRERAQLIRRRRRAVALLASATVAFALIGAIPHLHAALTLSVMAAVVLVTYLALLARVTRRELNAAERRAKVVHLPRAIVAETVERAEQSRRRYAPSNGVEPHVVYIATGAT